MMFNDTFNNISVCFRGLGLWCLTTLSTIFQFVLERLGLWVISTIFQFVLDVMMFNFQQ